MARFMEQKSALQQDITVGWILTCWAVNCRLDFNSHPSVWTDYVPTAQRQLSENIDVHHPTQSDDV